MRLARRALLLAPILLPALAQAADPAAAAPIEGLNRRCWRP